MNIVIISVGKLKERYLKEGIAEYSKRISAYAKLEFIEVSDEKAPENLSLAEMIQVKKKEGERILARIHEEAYVIALAIDGTMKSSEQFAELLDSLATHGRSRIVFVIGGSLGLCKNVLKRADEKLSFSKMTLPHQLMKLVLVEQIYRGMRINRGHAYHK